jgi:uncharacterized protein (DUF58 family)
MMPVTLTWRPSPLLHTLATLGLVGLATSVLLHAATPLALAAPGLLWLTWFGRPALPDSVEVAVDCAPRYCEEGDELSLELAATVPGGRLLDIACDLPGARPDNEEAGAATRRWSWHAPAAHWGRRPAGRGTLRLTTRGGLWVAQIPVTWPRIEIWPASGDRVKTSRSSRTRPWPGSRPASTTGVGAEPVGAVPYAPGAAVRRINWRRTMQRREWYVTEFAVERAQDVVVVVDATVESARDGESTLDATVRGAAHLARAHLEAGDRVGLVTITPAVGWVVPGLGRRHLVRVLHALTSLGERDSVVPPDLDRLPPAAVPRGSLVVVLSPLLSEQSVAIVGDLRRRGHPVLLVEVSPDDPDDGGEPLGRTAVRLWRLERRATLLALQDRGVRVLQWPPRTDLAVQLAEQLHDPAVREVVA